MEDIFRTLDGFLDSRYPIIAKLAEKEIFKLVDPPTASTTAFAS